MNEDWVPLQIPDNLDEMLEAFASDSEEKVGWCLLCNSPIRTAADLIPGTDTHDCEKGRAIEEQHAPQKKKPRCRPNRQTNQ
jgi:hypothetical protein